nr:hypothetical protein [Tanacetum cinerariifolium]
MMRNKEVDIRGGDNTSGGWRRMETAATTKTTGLNTKDLVVLSDGWLLGRRCDEDDVAFMVDGMWWAYYPCDVAAATTCVHFRSYICISEPHIPLADVDENETIDDIEFITPIMRMHKY